MRSEKRLNFDQVEYRSRQLQRFINEAVSYAAVVKIENKLDKSKTLLAAQTSDQNLAVLGKIDKPTHNSKETTYNLRAASSKKQTT